MTEAERLTYIAYKCKTSSEFFTKYMFKNESGGKFIVKKHHKLIFDALDKVLRGETTRLIINVPPRYGKTEIAVKKFIAQGFAINPASKFMHLSYSDDLTMDNSQFVRDLVLQPFYQELFPNVKLKADSNSKKKWYTTKAGLLYATSTGGQVTGFGAGTTDTDEEEDYEAEIRKFLEGQELEKEVNDFFSEVKEEKGDYKFAGALIVDDPIKPEDADSDLLRERINERFDTTILNRINSRTTPVIVIMQRLHEFDLCGHLLEKHKEKGWEVLSIPAIQTTEDGHEYALWPRKHTLEELYLEREKRPHYFERQYMQSPQPVEGRMYEEFQTYEQLPITRLARKKNYTDVADKGKDYLCSICYVQTEIGCYVTDLIYTKASTQNTEPMVVKMLNRNFTERARIESNNGGVIFARNIRNQLRISGNSKCFIEDFTQTQNKESRILNNRSDVTNLIIMPHDWQKRWPDFYTHVTSFRAEGQNAYDDAPDVLTGIVESQKAGSGLISVSTLRTNDNYNHR